MNDKASTTGTGSMIETVLFDLDGTIVDTNELIIASFLHTLEGVTPEPYTRDMILPRMGKPLQVQLQQFSGRDVVEDLVEKYRAFNFGKHDELVREFPHVRDVLAALHANGVRMGVVTSKVRLTVMKGLDLYGLTRYMETIVTVDDVKVPKPDPEGVLLALERMGAKGETALMVGDSAYDITAAQRAGIRSAGVAWSLRGPEYLRQFHPDYMLSDMRDLLDIVGVKRDNS